MASVYLIVNTVNGKKYVGFTTQAVRVRWRQHVEVARREPVYALHHAIVAHGAEAFEVRTLATGMGVEYALALEAAAIRSLGTMPGGYNLTTGGDRAVHSAETLARIAASNTGKKQSDETKARRSASLMGRKVSEETRAKIAAAHTGRKGPPVSEATRAKQSAARKGKKTGPMPETTRTKLSAAHKGKRLSAETCAKMSAAAKGKKKTAEHLAKMAATKRRKTDPQRLAALALVLSGVSAWRAGKEVGVDPATVRKWVRESAKDAIGCPPQDGGKGRGTGHEAE